MTAKPHLFLDMDGVLANMHAPTTFDRLRPACVARLDQLVAKTGVRVVLSSSWRTTWTPEQVRALLARRGYTGPLDSATPELKGHTRGAEIRAWLDAHRGEVSAYAILDDWDESEFTGMLDHLVRTQHDIGLTDDACARVEQVLARQQPDKAIAACLKIVASP